MAWNERAVPAITPSRRNRFAAVNGSGSRPPALANATTSGSVSASARPARSRRPGVLGVSWRTEQLLRHLRRPGRQHLGATATAGATMGMTGLALWSTPTQAASAPCQPRADGDETAATAAHGAAGEAGGRPAAKPRLRPRPRAGSPDHLPRRTDQSKPNRDHRRPAAGALAEPAQGKISRRAARDGSRCSRSFKGRPAAQARTRLRRAGSRGRRARGPAGLSGPRSRLDQLAGISPAAEYLEVVARFPSRSGRRRAAGEEGTVSPARPA